MLFANHPLPKGFRTGSRIMESDVSVMTFRLKGARFVGRRGLLMGYFFTSIGPISPIRSSGTGPKKQTKKIGPVSVVNSNV